MSYNTKAVITLQVGHYANFVGTNFWNAQDHSLYVPKGTNDLGKKIHCTASIFVCFDSEWISADAQREN